MENSTLDIEFSDLNYTVPVPRHRLKCWERRRTDETSQILQNMSGSFRAGELSAVLGPSGAGKTSLLSILAGFRLTGVSGNVFLNGVRRDTTVKCVAKRLCCLVPQEFAMLDVLTVGETLHIAVELKLGRSLTRTDQKIKVQDTCSLLGLEDCFNTPVAKLSGGEKKRLSCGVELLSNPPLMFFDEPTSGLDTCSAYQVLSHLRDLAHKDKRNIVCSIHQPSSRLFQMFDSVLVLARGRRVYHGSRENMVPALSEVEFQCPPFYNPADFVLEVATCERGDISALLNRSITSYTSYNNKPVPMIIEQGDKDEGVSLLVHEVVLPAKQQFDSMSLLPGCGSWKQFWVLLKRAAICNFRDLHMAKLRFLSNVLVGLLLGTLYYQIGNDASKLISNVGCVFFLIMFMFFSNAMPTVLTFPSEMAVMLREHLNGWYPVKSYYMARSIADIPLQLLCPSAFLVIAYWMTGQPPELRPFLQVWLVGVLLTLLAQSLGLFIGAAADVNMGIFLVPAISIPMLLFSGYFVRIKDIPAGLGWFSYLSPFRFAFESTLIAIYGFGREKLPCSEVYCSVRSPSKILQDLGLKEEDFSSCITILVIYILILRILLYIALRFRVCISK